MPERRDTPPLTGDDAVIDHVVENLVEPGAMKKRRRRLRSPTTSAGEPVEEQVQKEWDPNKQGGLPTP
jgi:hypothetical protein